MVCDSFWQVSFETRDLIEEIKFKKYKARLIRTVTITGKFMYPYRMFFFKQESEIPFLILSLEIGLRFGTCALGAHTQKEHINYGPADPKMSLSDFKTWALSTAEIYIL